eukprot:g15368.t2
MSILFLSHLWLMAVNRTSIEVAYSGRTSLRGRRVLAREVSRRVGTHSTSFSLKTHGPIDLMRRNPYSHGILQNAAQLCGRCGVDWLLPIAPLRPTSDGCKFLPEHRAGTRGEDYNRVDPEIGL